MPLASIELRPAVAADYHFARTVHHAGMRWIAERVSYRRRGCAQILSAARRWQCVTVTIGRLVGRSGLLHGGRNFSRVIWQTRNA
jgi:hypothetical protein